jgi:membrane-bound lytic murein transglycosylase A
MPPSTAKRIIGYSSSKLAIMISISKLISREQTPRILACSVFVLAIAGLLTACSTPSTRGSGYRSSGNAPTSYSSSIASFRSVSWQDLPGWQEDDLTQAWPAWLKSCDALRKRNSEMNWRQACAQAGNVSARDGRAIRQYFEGNFQV